MADFVQTMKDWRRMCSAQDDGSNSDVCATCPCGMIVEACFAIYEGDMNYAKVEEVVSRWAAEHPEPVYPTWLEWLCEIGVIPTVIRCDELYLTAYNGIHDNKIPADIAEKLGLQPKEGVQ